jgi:excinuclease ABC subunit A
MELAAQADWVIDIGPGGGGAGGAIVAQGTPEQIVKAKGSVTGPYLDTVLRAGNA